MERWISCLLLLMGLTGVAQQATYHDQISYLIEKNCVSCHSAGSTAPFSLETYQDIFSRAKQIKYVMQHKLMPPWSPDPAYRTFVNQRCLTPGDLSLLTSWIEQGMPEGTKSKKSSAGYSPKRKPDLVLQLPEFRLPANAVDTIVHFKIPYQIAGDTTANAIAFIPQNRAVVHHANALLYNNTGNAFFSELPNGFKIDGIINADGSLSNERFYDSQMEFFSDYTPGRSLQTMPGNDFCFHIPARGFFLCQVHYGPTIRSQTDQSRLEVFFAPGKVTRVGEARKLGSQGGIAEPYSPLVIQPGEQRTFTIDFISPSDVSLIMYGGHMHLLGRKFLAYAVTNTGDTIPLLRINDYNFYLQDNCIPEHPVVIKQGTRIHVEALYDNTEDNPYNPSHPPRLVKEGWRTNEEMMAFWMYLVKYLPGDENLILSN